MNIEDKKKLAKSLGELIKEKCGNILNHNLKSMLEEIINNYFTENKIISLNDKRGILKFLALSLHSDKTGLLDNSLFTTTKDILDAMPLEESSLEIPKTTANNDYTQIINPNIGSVFCDSKIEQIIANLQRTYPSINKWYSNQKSAAMGIFYKQVKDIRQREPLPLMNDLRLFLLRIALFEALVQEICPDKTVEEVIELLKQRESSYQEDNECKKDPILWLCNSLIFHFATPITNEITTHSDEIAQFPLYFEILKNLFIYDTDYANPETLSEMLQIWPESHLPHMRNLFQNLINEPPYFNPAYSDYGKVKFNSRENTIAINDDSECGQTIIKIYRINSSSKKLVELEADRRMIVDFATNSDFLKLPPMFLFAQFEIKYSESYRMPFDQTLGEVLNEKLIELNAAINKQRASMASIQEDLEFQPTFGSMKEPLFLFFRSSTGIEVPYMQNISGIENNYINLYKDYPFLNDLKLFLPSSIHPDIAKALDQFRRELPEKIDRPTINKSWSRLTETIPNKILYRPITLSILGVSFTALLNQKYPNQLNREHLQKWKTKKINELESARVSTITPVDVFVPQQKQPDTKLSSSSEKQEETEINHVTLPPISDIPPTPTQLDKHEKPSDLVPHEAENETNSNRNTETSSPAKNTNDNTASIFRPINDEKLTELQTIVENATTEYIQWNRSKNNRSDDSRGAHGIFTTCRHTNKGIVRAELLWNNVQKATTAEAAKDYIDQFLNDYYRFGGKYNTHSCASFLLEKLVEIKDSPWSELKLTITARSSL